MKPKLVKVIDNFKDVRKKTWEETYEKKFGDWKNCPHHMLKAFIRKTIQEARKEGEEFGYKKGYSDGLSGITSKTY